MTCVPHTVRCVSIVRDSCEHAHAHAHAHAHVNMTCDMCMHMLHVHMCMRMYFMLRIEPRMEICAFEQKKPFRHVASHDGCALQLQPTSHVTECFSLGTRATPHALLCVCTCPFALLTVVFVRPAFRLSGRSDANARKLETLSNVR